VDQSTCVDHCTCPNAGCVSGLVGPVNSLGKIDAQGYGGLKKRLRGMQSEKLWGSEKELTNFRGGTKDDKKVKASSRKVQIDLRMQDTKVCKVG
jgi:hypothetical protein